LMKEFVGRTLRATKEFLGVGELFQKR
jgi:hypothetical protein